MVLKASKPGNACTCDAGDCVQIDRQRSVISDTMSNSKSLAAPTIVTGLVHRSHSSTLYSQNHNQAELQRAGPGLLPLCRPARQWPETTQSLPDSTTLLVTASTLCCSLTGQPPPHCFFRWQPPHYCSFTEAQQHSLWPSTSSAPSGGAQRLSCHHPQGGTHSQPGTPVAQQPPPALRWWALHLQGTCLTHWVPLRAWGLACHVPCWRLAWRGLRTLQLGLAGWMWAGGWLLGLQRVCQCLRLL